MTLGLNDLLVVDTNILVHWMRRDRTGEFLQKRYKLDDRIERPLFSTVSEGELLGLAACWKWGGSRIAVLRELLDELVRLNTGMPEVVEAFAELYCKDQRHGWNTGENDLWIAACTKATGAVLLTCDADFLRISPRLIRVEHVSEIS